MKSNNLFSIRPVSKVDEKETHNAVVRSIFKNDLSVLNLFNAVVVKTMKSDEV